MNFDKLKERPHNFIMIKQDEHLVIHIKKF